MNTDWIALCRQVENKRKIKDIFQHANFEMDELDEEIFNLEEGFGEGDDGVVGEAVDVILCMLDIIAMHDPDINMEVLEQVMHKKYSKWIRNYTNVEQKLQEE